MVAVLAPIRERAAELTGAPGRVDEILAAGAATARARAAETMTDIHERMGFLRAR